MADRYEDRYRGEEPRWPRREERYPREDRDRGFFDRAGDEVRSWFGDEDAERRRRMDEHRHGREYPREYGRDYPREYGRDYPREGTRDYGRDREYGRDYPRDREYGRDWDYGHRMGFDYERHPGEWRYANDWRGGAYGYPRERGWSGERWGATSSAAPLAGREYHLPYSGYREYNDTGRYGQGVERGRGMEGWYAGRGPRGYQRSDDRIREDVCDRLSDDPWVDASDVEVTVRGGEVTLSGAVHDRNDKRRAEDLIESISGVREVHNNLRVSGTSSTTGSTWSTSGVNVEKTGTTQKR